MRDQCLLFLQATRCCRECCFDFHPGRFVATMATSTQATQQQLVLERHWLNRLGSIQCLQNPWPSNLNGFGRHEG